MQQEAIFYRCTGEAQTWRMCWRRFLAATYSSSTHKDVGVQRPIPTVVQVKRKTLVEDVLAEFVGGDLVERLGGPAVACAAAVS